MSLRVRSMQDLLAGLLFVAIALAALWIGRDYPVGTAVRMSTGYFPRVLCVLLFGFGIFNIVRGFAVSGPALGGVDLRAVVLVPAAVILFALALRPAGLVIATMLATIVGGLASAQVRLLEIFVTGAVLAALSVGIFVWGIGLLIPIWPSF